MKNLLVAILILLPGLAMAQQRALPADLHVQATTPADLATEPCTLSEDNVAQYAGGSIQFAVVYDSNADGTPDDPQIHYCSSSTVGSGGPDGDWAPFPGPEACAHDTPTTTTLRGLDGSLDTVCEVVYSSGYTTEEDGGQGIWWWNSDDTRADNDGVIVQVGGVATGRWNRVIEDTHVDPRWWGAVCDGVSDTQPDFEAAEDWAQGDYEILVPNGTCALGSTWVINHDGVSVFGNGTEESTISRLGVGAGVAIQADNSRFRNFTFAKNYPTVSEAGAGFTLLDQDTAEFDNVVFRNIRSNAIITRDFNNLTVKNSRFDTIGASGIFNSDATVTGSRGQWILHNEFIDNGLEGTTGLASWQGNIGVSDVWIDNNLFDGNGTVCIGGDITDNFQVTNNHVYNCVNEGVAVSGENVLVQGNKCFGNPTTPQLASCYLYFMGPQQTGSPEDVKFLNNYAEYAGSVFSLAFANTQTIRNLTVAHNTSGPGMTNGIQSYIDVPAGGTVANYGPDVYVLFNDTENVSNFSLNWYRGANYNGIETHFFGNNFGEDGEAVTASMSSERYHVRQEIDIDDVYTANGCVKEDLLSTSAGNAPVASRVLSCPQINPPTTFGEFAGTWRIPDNWTDLNFTTRISGIYAVIHNTNPLNNGANVVVQMRSICSPVNGTRPVDYDTPFNNSLTWTVPATEDLFEIEAPFLGNTLANTCAPGSQLYWHWRWSSIGTAPSHLDLKIESIGIYYNQKGLGGLQP